MFASRHFSFAIASAALAALLGAFTQSATGATPDLSSRQARLGLGAVVNLRELAAAAAPAPSGSVPAIPQRSFRKHRPGMGATAPLAALALPQPRPTPFGRIDGLQGFTGLTHADQRLADNGNQDAREPPDQGLAVANGYVVEAVNTAVAVYADRGRTQLALVSLNRLFGLASEIDRTTDERGPQLTDPRVYYDGDTARWFVSAVSFQEDPPGGTTIPSRLYLAVSRTADPSGAWQTYTIDTDQTDNPHCPCYPDFPQLGADRYGVYLSGALYGSRSFQSGQDSLVGAGIFVMPKDVLTAPHAPGTSIDPTVKEFIVKGESYIMPAYAAPGGGPQESRGRGTEYLVSSDPGDCSVRCDRLHLFALSGTSTLRSGLVRLRLDERDVAVEPYALPIAAPQRDGPRPYAASLVAPGAPLPPVPRLDAVDSGINASMLFAGGVLWPTLSTSVAGPHGIAKDGIAYFGLAPRLAADGRLISVRVERQGYVVAPDDTFLLFPSVTADALGRGAIGFTVAGAARHPSAGFAPLRRGSVGPIVVAAAGALPADGYTGYDANDPQAQGTEAWGDYSAATFDEAGTVWLGAEYVPDTRVSPRTSEANWGTWLTRYKPW